VAGAVAHDVAAEHGHGVVAETSVPPVSESPDASGEVQS
jgi:hypothetical protein